LVGLGMKKGINRCGRLIPLGFIDFDYIIIFCDSLPMVTI
jgi:hypothetical protein